jgi:hypothetical protein
MMDNQQNDGGGRPPRYPDAPGHRGVDTSVSAAADMAPHLGRLQRLARSTIVDAGRLGCTAEELAERLSIDRGAIQPRTTELRHKRLIADSGQRRANRNGKRAIVWVAPEHVQPLEKLA